MISTAWDFPIRMKSNQKEEDMLEHYFLEITQNEAAIFGLKQCKQNSDFQCWSDVTHHGRADSRKKD